MYTELLDFLPLQDLLCGFCNNNNTKKHNAAKKTKELYM